MSQVALNTARHSQLNTLVATWSFYWRTEEEKVRVRFIFWSLKLLKRIVDQKCYKTGTVEKIKKEIRQCMCKILKKYIKIILKLWKLCSPSSNFLSLQGRNNPRNIFDYKTLFKLNQKYCRQAADKTILLPKSPWTWDWSLPLWTLRWNFTRFYPL